MSSPDLGVIGIYVFLLTVIVIILELALAGYWSIRLALRAQMLGARLSTERALLHADVERLRANIAEMKILWQPYRRVLRLLRHPITIALMQSLMRRIAG